jgi:hypothetical protein
MSKQPVDLADKIAARLTLSLEVRTLDGGSVHVRDLAKIVRRTIAKDRRRRGFELYVETEWVPAWRKALEDAGIEIED